MGFRIGIDARWLFKNVAAGVERYTSNIINSLVRVDRQNSYTLFIPKGVEKGRIENLNISGFDLAEVPSLPLNTQVGLAYTLLEHRVDLLFCPFHTIPGAVKPFQKIVSFIHGLEYQLDERSAFDKLKFDTEILAVSLLSDALIVPSETTKTCLLNLSKLIKPSKVSVIPEGVDTKAFNRRSPSEILQIKEKYVATGRRYIISVSTLMPRKNIDRLLTSFSELVQEGGVESDVDLLICGKIPKGTTETLLIQGEAGIKSRIRFLGRVPDLELPALLSGAEVFVNVSLLEGFALTLLEAMACGCRCVVSDIEPFRATASGIATFVDPKNIQSIKRGISSSLKEENFSKWEETIKRVTEFSWEKSAERTLDIFHGVLKNP